MLYLSHYCCRDIKDQLFWFTPLISQGYMRLSVVWPFDSQNLLKLWAWERGQRQRSHRWSYNLIIPCYAIAMGQIMSVWSPALVNEWMNEWMNICVSVPCIVQVQWVVGCLQNSADVVCCRSVHLSLDILWSLTSDICCCFRKVVCNSWPVVGMCLRHGKTAILTLICNIILTLMLVNSIFVIV